MVLPLTDSPPLPSTGDPSRRTDFSSIDALDGFVTGVYEKTSPCERVYSIGFTMVMGTMMVTFADPV